MDYEPIARLGRGGMGVVDLARDAAGEQVAMKRLTLRGSASEIALARQRLLREADVLRRLHHPNIVRLIEVVEEDDEIILVMPYLSGGNLAERVAQHGPAPPADVERLGERLLGALAAAHQAGIIHRDIKPANVLYDSEGEPMLADFGVAHTLDQTRGLTVAGMVVGTPGYMPPEQARDEALTPATDIFSLGATLLFAATGNGPYGNGDPGLLMVRAANDEVEPLSRGLPEHMRGWLASMLDPEPEYRPTAVALLTGQGLPPRRRRGRLIRARNLALAATLALVAVVVALIVSQEDGGSGLPDAAPSDGADSDGRETGAGPGDTDGELDGAPSGSVDTDGMVTDDGNRVLVDSLDGEFTERELDGALVFEVPPAPVAGDYCDVAGEPHVLEVGLEVTEGVTAQLSVRDDAGRVRDADAARSDQVVLTVEQEVCPSPGETLWAEVALVAPEVRDSPDELGGYVLTRDEG